MKKIIAIVALFIGLSAVAQTGDNIAFNKEQFSFGQIKQGKPVTTEFVFTNKNAQPLIIETATAECGCTTPEYPLKPILKGQTGVVKVTYNAESMGKFTKRVHVKFAKIDEPIVLTIEGEVVSK